MAAGELTSNPGESPCRRITSSTLEEEILSLPADTAAPLFDKTTWIGSSAAQSLVDLFTSRGTFRSRESVESDPARVQALPVVVVRNGSGDLLRLKRREQRQSAPRQDRDLGRRSCQAGGRRQWTIHRTGRGPRASGRAPYQRRAFGTGVARRRVDPRPRWRQDAAPCGRRLRVARANGRCGRRSERNGVLRTPGNVTQRKLRRAASACERRRRGSDLRALERRDCPASPARGQAGGTEAGLGLGLSPNNR